MEVSSTGVALSKGLTSSNYITRLLTWDLIYLEEFFKAYSPLVYRAVVFLVLLLPIPQLPFDIGEVGEQLSQYFKSDDAEAAEVADIEATLSQTSRSLSQYSTFVDDRQVKGDISDIRRLQEHGYNKFRYLSPSFVEKMRAASLHVEAKEKSIKGGKHKLKQKSKKPKIRVASVAEVTAARKTKGKKNKK